MNLIADEKIPYLELFTPHCRSIKTMPGTRIDKSSIHNADILLTRTVTPINEILLSDRDLKFIGTATAGTDHVDLNYLKKRAIPFAHAPGANAKAVADYVICTIAALVHNNLFDLKKNTTVGIIGYGHIGKQLADRLSFLGFKVLCHDPFIDSSKPHRLTTLQTLLSQSNIISLHTPLTHQSTHPTYHLIKDHNLSLLKKGAVLINTSRGSVIDENALKYRDDLILCLDVFENEPNISRETLKKTIIATPHIAGYSEPSKHRATMMLYLAAAKILNWPLSSQIAKPTQPTPKNSHWIDTALNIFDPLQLSKQFKNQLKMTRQIDEIFLSARNHYALRKEIS